MQHLYGKDFNNVVVVCHDGFRLNLHSNNNIVPLFQLMQFSCMRWKVSFASLDKF